MEYRPYPRYVAGPAGTYRIVQNADEEAEARAAFAAVTPQPRKPGRPKKDQSARIAPQE